MNERKTAGRRPGMTHALPLPRFLFLAAVLAALAVFLVGDGVPPAQAQNPPPLSTNANLSALTASASDSAGGTFTPLTLSPAFDKATTAYTGSVANGITHAKLTPTVEDTGKAAVQVGKSGSLATVTSGSASDAIALDVGANELIVQVTAEDTTTTRDYTVTITRAASNNANLSGLTVSMANVGSSTFTDLPLTPAFDRNTRFYVADLGRPSWSYHVPVYVDRVKVTPTVADTGKATVQVGREEGPNGNATVLTTVTSGEASEAISLGLFLNDIIVRVTAEDGRTTRYYSITADRYPSLTSILGVWSGDGALHAEWNAPSFDRDTVTGYDVHYTSSRTVAGDAELGSDVATEWVDAGHSGDVLQTEHSITGLTNGTAYRVRVRSVTNVGGGSPDVGGDWSSGAATPQSAASDATLRALTAASSESRGGTYTALTLSPAFDSNTTGYTASVANSRNHVKLNVQVTRRDASVGVARSADADRMGFSHTLGAPTSKTIPLDVGDNVIIVRVRAGDYKTYKDYTVTVTRQVGGL